MSGVHQPTVAFVVGVLGVIPIACDQGGCEKDSDCKDDRVCEERECVDPVVAVACGDELCDFGENCFNCSADCGPCGACGNDVCEPGESCGGCSEDCGTCPTCGDGTCDAHESCDVCAGDCGPCAASCVWSGEYAGLLPCGPLGPKAKGTVDLLVAVWGTSPLFACGYLPAMPPKTVCGRPSANDAQYCPKDQSLAADLGLLAALDLAYGPLASVAVLAHEWGHVNQHNLGLLAAAPTLELELHADCQAGLFVAALELGQVTDLGEVGVAFSAMCQFGEAEGYPWFAPATHGTCDERSAAFEYGYLIGLGLGERVCGDAKLQISEVCERFL